MFVYVVWDNCPNEWDNKKIDSIFLNRKNAIKYLSKKIKENAYVNQYLEVKRFKVEMD